jgi:formylglycine-generating enzyme required for sulfatase activity
MSTEERIPPRLAQLGYEAHVLGGVEVILPPLCDVPAGAFLMGSDPARDKQSEARERPQHEVTLAAFGIARHPVTVAEYACFVRAGRAEPKRTYGDLDWQAQRQRPDHPVVNVAWHDAAAYAGWLTQATGEPWRLPSEAEWEKASRWDAARGRALIYPWGNGFVKARANTAPGGKGATTPAGSYPTGASPCGAQDMAGNVWEWTSSLFWPYPYDHHDGRESAASAGARTLRGGSWDHSGNHARAAYRLDERPDFAWIFIGFRLARSRR